MEMLVLGAVKLNLKLYEEKTNSEVASFSENSSLKSLLHLWRSILFYHNFLLYT